MRQAVVASLLARERDVENDRRGACLRRTGNKILGETGRPDQLRSLPSKDIFIRHCRGLRE
jgi:hypothetical protein